MCVCARYRCALCAALLCCAVAPCRYLSSYQCHLPCVCVCVCLCALSFSVFVGGGRNTSRCDLTAQQSPASQQRPSSMSSRPPHRAHRPACVCTVCVRNQRQIDASSQREGRKETMCRRKTKRERERERESTSTRLVLAWCGGATAERSKERHTRHAMALCRALRCVCVCAVAPSPLCVCVCAACRCVPCCAPSVCSASWSLWLCSPILLVRATVLCCAPCCPVHRCFVGSGVLRRVPLLCVRDACVCITPGWALLSYSLCTTPLLHMCCSSAASHCTFFERRCVALCGLAAVLLCRVAVCVCGWVCVVVVAVVVRCVAGVRGYVVLCGPCRAL